MDAFTMYFAAHLVSSYIRTYAHKYKCAQVFTNCNFFSNLSYVQVKRKLKTEFIKYSTTIKPKLQY